MKLAVHARPLRICLLTFNNVTDPCAAHARHLFPSCSDMYSFKNEDKTLWMKPGWVTLNDSEEKLNNSQLRRLCPKPWRYQKTNNQEYTVSGDHGTYHSNGYVAELGHNMSSATRTIDTLKNNDWIDRRTRAVFLEFSLYNPSTQQIVVVAFNQEFIGTGGFTQNKNIDILQLELTESVFYFICKLLLILFVIFYFAKECVKFYHQRLSYLFNKWNWLELSQLVSVVLTIVYHTSTKLTLQKSTGQFRLNPYGQVSFQEPVFFSQRETVATAIMIFFSTLKLLKMNNINPHVKIFFDTCTRIWNFLPTFFISSAVLMLAFGHSGYIAFGSDSWDYSTVPRALRSQFLMLIGTPMPMADLEHADPILARLFAFAFLIFCSVMLVNLLITMIMDSHSEAAQIDRNSERYELWSFMTGRASEWFNRDE